MNKRNYTGHICILVASILWGLMSPIGKAAMTGAVSPLILVMFRMVGGAVCFWMLSLFGKNERVPLRDIGQFFFASLFGTVLNQGTFLFGLSLTSPIDASIITTLAPIATMVLAALFLREPVTRTKVTGVLLGAVGALILIVGSAEGGGRGSNVWGDLLCFTSQVSYATYLTRYKGLITKYSPVTCMKWMFTYSALCFIPFSVGDMATFAVNEVPLVQWAEIVYVVICGTFVTFLLMMIAQRILRPTVLSMYNYTQPIVASSVAVMMGLGTFGWDKGAAVVLVFLGVYLVTLEVKKLA